MIPAIVFGLPAGVAVDALPRRPLLVTLNLLRFFFVMALVVRPPSLPGIFATTLAIWLIHQFYAPAESSTLASIVPRNRLVDGQALSNLALVIAQAIGVIAIAPLLLKTSDPRYLFAVCSALFLTAAGLVFQIHIGELQGAARANEPPSATASRRRCYEDLRVTTGDSVLFRVTAADVMVGIGLSALVVVAPIYLKRILNTSSENTVFVFAPAAIGVLLGLRAVPYLGRYFGLRWVAVYGLALFALSIAAFGFLERNPLDTGRHVPHSDRPDCARACTFHRWRCWSCSFRFQPDLPRRSWELPHARSRWSVRRWHSAGR